MVLQWFLFWFLLLAGVGSILILALAVGLYCLMTVMAQREDRESGRERW